MSTLINILGTDRSGSTMLDLMLGNDEKAFSLGEVQAWFRPYREHHFKILCSCGKDPCPYWEKIQNIPEKAFHKKAFKILNIDYLIDSSKDLNWAIDNNIWAKKNNIKVFNIVLYKDPVNYIYSIWKRGNKNIDHAVHQYITYYRRLSQTKLPYVAIRYEQLSNETDSILMQICNITGEKYFTDKKSFWTKQHHHAFGSMGTRKQVEAGTSIIRSKEVFPKEFQELIPGIEEKIKNNLDLNYIHDELLAHDIKDGYKPNKTNIVKPYWYFVLKVKSQYKRIFPSKWKHVQ